jgi:hypothetical protein
MVLSTGLNPKKIDILSYTERSRLARSRVLLTFDEFRAKINYRGLCFLFVLVIGWLIVVDRRNQLRVNRRK